MLDRIEAIDKYIEWIEDEEPCLINIPLPEESFLTPKIKFETGVINPALKDEILDKVIEILQ